VPDGALSYLQRCFRSLVLVFLFLPALSPLPLKGSLHLGQVPPPTTGVNPDDWHNALSGECPQDVLGDADGEGHLGRRDVLTLFFSFFHGHLQRF
jgi:hypothetical protein